MAILNTPSLDQIIDLHDAEQRVSGKITLCLTVAATVTFSAGPVHSLDLQSVYSLSQITKIIESLSGEEPDKFSPIWRRFIHSLGAVASTAQKIGEVRKHLSPCLNKWVDMNDDSSIHQFRSPWELWHLRSKYVIDSSQLSHVRLPAYR